GGIEAPCQDEYVMSPIIDMTRYSANCDNVQDTEIPSGVLGSLGGAYLRFTAYVDLPMQNLVFYYWDIRNIDGAGCPGEWEGTNEVYYSNWGYPPQYRFVTQDIGHLVESDAIQIRLGCVDMCDSWYEVYGNCADHTPAPWFDNVRIYRFEQSGPQWSWRDLDIFQDNFPAGADIESFVRADAANDLRPSDVPIVDPGDSIVVQCTSPLGGGIDTTIDGWPKVYMHCYVPYIGDPLSPKPTLYGPQLAGNYGRYASNDGSAWTVLQCDYARMGSGGVIPNRFMVDMNDSLLTRGYQIFYYFKAYDVAGETSTLPAQAEEAPWPLPPYYDWAHVPYFFEWTCLPTLRSNTLYVDDFHGRGTPNGMAEVYWNPTFEAVIPPDNQPDRYDVNSPTSMVGNGPGSRARTAHLTGIYYRIIWDSGNLETGTITDGTWYSDKSNDVQMIIDWIEGSAHRTGLVVCGNGIASDLAGSPSPAAAQLLADYCGVALVNESYYDLTGGNVIVPKLTAMPDAGNTFWHTTWGDSFYLFQSTCPWSVKFDVLDKTGPGEYALRYPDYGGSPYYAGIYAHSTNGSGYDIRTMWFGFSFMYVRDCWEEYHPDVPIMRNIILSDLIQWQQGDVNTDITEIEEVPAVNNLAANFPNPFNPVTSISFGLREKGHVTLRLYDVAGRLVRTLVDEVRNAGRYEAVWNGRNNNNAAVASGVYFYRMKTSGFEQTRKMVLLK
nr:FlgD immunoglobulin-like domain containing protein [Patescibacteria group bacterium]